MLEEWRKIKGWPGYEVSNEGRVRSYRSTSGKNKTTYHMKKLTFHPGGRMVVCLWSNCELLCAKVHRLVLEAFVGRCPKGKEGSHLDGNCRNNALSNLRWETPTENHARKDAHGTKLQGETSYLHKLTEKQIREIRLFMGVISRGECAARYNVTQSNIGYIWRFKTWKHVL